jgi:anti-sigma factor RsiW
MTYRHTSHLHGDYLDGDLSADQRAELDRHLAECKRCRDDFEKLKKLKMTLESIESPDPGDDYFDNMLAIVDANAKAFDQQALTLEPPQDYRLTNQQILKTLIRIAAAITLLFMSFYISDFSKERQRIQWTEKLVEEGFIADDQINPADPTYQPAGINMIGSPSPLEKEDTRSTIDDK